MRCRECPAKSKSNDEFGCFALNYIPRRFKDNSKGCCRSNGQIRAKLRRLPLEYIKGFSFINEDFTRKE